MGNSTLGSVPVAISLWRASQATVMLLGLTLGPNGRTMGAAFGADCEPTAGGVQMGCCGSRCGKGPVAKPAPELEKKTGDCAPEVADDQPTAKASKPADKKTPKK